jgi:hypothetical protein
MPRTGRPTVLTPAVVKKVADCFFDGLSNEETALLCEIDVKTIRKARVGDLFPAIKKAESGRKQFYIRKLRDGKRQDWTRIAWFLERRYPQEFAKPEVLMQVSNNTLNQVNNTLVITAEVASSISKRRKEVESKVEKLFKDRRKRTQIGLRDVNGNGEAHDSGQESETPESPHSDKD